MAQGSNDHSTLPLSLYQVNFLFLVKRVHGFGKKLEKIPEEWRVVESEPEARCLVRIKKWAGSKCTSSNCMQQPFNRCSDAAFWKVGEFVLRCSFLPQLKMLLVTTQAR